MSDLASLRAAVAQSPDNVPLLLLFARTALDEWEIEEAKEAYRRVGEIAPGNPEGILGLATALFQEGQASQAAVRLETLLRDSPDFGPAWSLLARIHLSESNRKEAIDCYRRAVESDRSCLDAKLASELGIDPSGRPPAEARATAGGGGSAYGGLDADDGWRDEDDEDRGASSEEDFAAMAERPDIDFSKVGGMEALKEEIRMKILYPMQNPDLFRAYGKSIGGGVLLYGPPGCGKTLISRATAGEIQATFFCIGLHDILDMWIGNSEKNLHAIFESARRHAPSVLFFDEIDALAADRRDLRQSAGRGLINQFLAEMDGGTANNDGVLVLGATNAPWHIDGAFKRPGRFDRTLFVPPPDEAAREAIAAIMAEGKPVADFDPKALARKTSGFSGADLKAVFDQATESALGAAMKVGRIVPVNTKSLAKAAAKHRPSTLAWFETAKNYALYANQGGFYDEVLEHLGLKKQ